MAGANPALLQSAVEVRCTVIPALSAPKLARRTPIIRNSCMNIQYLYRRHESNQRKSNWRKQAKSRAIPFRKPTVQAVCQR
jgi:hypothetical protein